MIGQVSGKSLSFLLIQRQFRLYCLLIFIYVRSLMVILRSCSFISFSSSKQTYSAPLNKSAAAWSVHIICENQVLLFSITNMSYTEEGRLTGRFTLVNGFTLKKTILKNRFK